MPAMTIGLYWDAEYFGSRENQVKFFDDKTILSPAF